MDEQLQKYFLGELDEIESLAFLERVKVDDSLQKEFIETKNANALLGLIPLEDDQTTGRKSYNEFIGVINNKKRRKLFSNVFKYAAIATILIATAWWGSYHFYKQSPNLALNSLYVPAGQRACLTMEDGTKVWLNAQSTLTYPAHFLGNERRVNLTGEAFFEVAKDESKPFIVSSKDIEINVLGTKFNVHSYPETDFVETSLIEGSVKVSALGSSGKDVTLKPNEQVIVRKGQMNVSEIENFSCFSWKEGIYSFEDESFKDIICKLELYYDVKIIVKDPSIWNFVYTGKFRQRDGIDEILHIIQKIHKFKISKNEDRSIITLSK